MLVLSPKQDQAVDSFIFAMWPLVYLEFDDDQYDHNCHHICHQEGTENELYSRDAHLEKETEPSLHSACLNHHYLFKTIMLPQEQLCQHQQQNEASSDE